MAIALAPICGGLWAQDAPTASHTRHKTRPQPYHNHNYDHDVCGVAQQRKIDALSAQLDEMQKQQADLVIADQGHEGADGGRGAGRAGQCSLTRGRAQSGHYRRARRGGRRRSRADQKGLAANLGVSIHGLVDAGYEHNFNQPNGETNALRAWDQDGFQLTQGNLHIEKDGTVGFVTDINVGQVAEAIQRRRLITPRVSRRRPRSNGTLDRSDPVLSDLYAAGWFGNQPAGRHDS